MRKFSFILLSVGILFSDKVSLKGEVVPAERLTSWRGNIGVPGGIPIRTSVHITLNPGVSAAQISDAVNSCPPGKVVQLNAGLYELGENQIRIYNRDNWTLRGAGMGKTILRSSNGNNVIAVGNAPWLSQWPAAKEIVAGATKGSSSISVAGGTSGVNVNELIWIEQPNSGNIFGHGSGGSNTATAFPGVHRMNDVSAVLGCRVFVTAINGPTITFTPPLPFDFDGSPRVIGYGGIDGPILSGIEDLTVNGSSGNGVNIQGTYGFWLKNVEVTNYEKVGIVCWWGANTELRGCYIHDPASFNWSRGYAAELNSVNHSLIEDNILYKNQGGIFIQGATVANVISYNCAFRIYPVYPSGVTWQLASFQMNHATHSKYNLWEGNYGNYFQADFYYGGSSNGTLVRNFIAGFDPDTTENLICVSIDSRNWDWNVVGNVLGLKKTPDAPLVLQKAGTTVNWAMPNGTISWTYGATSTDAFGYGARRIFRLGYPSSGQNSFSGTRNPPAMGSEYGYLDLSIKPGGSHQTIIHGNWDAANNLQIWDPAIQDRTIPKSYYLTNTPDWFGSLLWPPYDPANPPASVTDALSRIPAGYRLLNNKSALPEGGDTTPPTVPTGLNASPSGPNQVTLHWNTSLDNVGVRHYRIERAQGVGSADFTQIAIAIAAPFTDSGLPVGTTYIYRVCAMDITGNQSVYSNVATAIVEGGADTMAPTTPANLTAIAAGAHQINLTWNVSTDDVGVTGYEIERSQPGVSTAFNVITSHSVANFVDTGLLPETAYFYRVRAHDAAGNVSEPSAVAQCLTGNVYVNQLAAAFGFNETTGSTVIDSSGNGNEGLISGAARTDQGKYGGALLFNGTSDLVLVNSSATLNLPAGMTIEAWIYPTASQSGWRAVLHKNKDAYYLHASSPDGPMRPAGGAVFAGKEQYTPSGAAIPPNTWTHLAVTYNGTSLNLYVNGVQVSARTVTGAVQVNALPLHIGGNSYSDQYFKGIIDEVRIYGRALSQNEIQTDMITPISNPPPPTPSGLRIVPTPP